MDSRGRHRLSVEIQQAVYNTWVENSIHSTDGRNGRNMVNISKRKYLSKYGNIENKGVVVDEKSNKKGHTYFSANRVVVTCTVRAIWDKLIEGGVHVSLGKILSLLTLFYFICNTKRASFVSLQIMLEHKNAI